MLIVEGPDGGGKTSLVDRLGAGLHLETRPRSSTSDQGPVPDLMGWLQRDFASNTHIGVYDRHPLVSEPIYGPLIRPQDPRLGTDEMEIMEMFERLYLTSPLVIIYCLPSLQSVRVNIARSHVGETDHLKGVLKHVDQLYAAYYYRYLLDASRGVGVRWNYDEPRGALQYEDICSLARNCSGRGVAW